MEALLQRAVCDFMSQRGVPWARNHTGTRGRTKFGLRIPSLEGDPETRGGGPDLFVAPRGVRVVVVRSMRDAHQALRDAEEPFFMELKAGTELRQSQKAWIHFMRQR